MRIPHFSAIALVLCSIAGANTTFAAQENLSVPLFFVENQGQTDASVRFMVKRAGFSAYFRRDEVLLAMGGHTLPMRLVGVSSTTTIAPGEPLAGRVSFLGGADSTRWKADLPMKGSIVYQAPWSGIDVTFSRAGGRLKSEFIVAPFGDVDLIRWNYGAHAGATVMRDGTLSVKWDGPELIEEAPVVYQELANGSRTEVKGEFHIFPSGDVGFRLGEYDHSKPLVIDPVIAYSTFLGGYGQDVATAVAVDPGGNSYVAGWTTSPDFSGVNLARTPSGGSVDAFVAKFSAGGNTLVYCTYLGGRGDDRAYGLAVDSAGNAYVTGWTSSSNFPMVNAPQPIFGGSRDAFVSKLNTTGTALVYSTYLGGSGFDGGNGIAVDRLGNAYIAGDTTSLNFPVVAAYQAAAQGQQDAFVAKLNAAGTAFVYSTRLGGNGDDHAAAIAVDAAGNAYVTGSTFSNNFPVLNALQVATGGNQDGFVTKLSTVGNLVYSTYLGGSGGTPGLPEGGTGIAVDSKGSAYVAGVTSSLNFPSTAGAFQAQSGGGNIDGFVAKINPTGSALLYATYLGGASIDCATSIAIDFLGNAYVAGYTASLDFPTLRYVQPGNRGLYDAFLTKLNTTGSAIIYSTYLGGSSSDAANAVAVDFLGNAIVAGQSSSSDFPLVTAVQASNYDQAASFVTKIAAGWTAALVISGTWIEDTFHNGGSDGQRLTAKIFGFGQAGDIPLLGDWDGTGRVRVGVFRDGVWMLDLNGNGVWDGPAGGDRQLGFGMQGDIPLLGDWDGTGKLKAGLFRQGYWILDFAGHLQGVPTGIADVGFYYGFGAATPVVGDWTGTGTTKIGIFYNGGWYLDWNGDYAFTGAADRAFTYGTAGDIPLVGDWDGSGASKPGVFRNGLWILDYNGDWSMGTIGATEIGFYFGAAGFTPVVGK